MVKSVHVMMGNHDDRGNLSKVFREIVRPDGFVHAAVDYQGLRLILLDTTDARLHGGAFCERRASWLRHELDGAGDQPVLIFLHHPPVELGLRWVDPGPDQLWTHNLRTVIAGRPIAAICAGHVHTSAMASWHGVPVLVCPSTSSDLTLTFSEMDPSHPDDRPLVEQGEPAFALHRWSGGRLVSFCSRCPQKVLERWDEKTQIVVAEMIAERTDASSDVTTAPGC